MGAKLANQSALKSFTAYVPGPGTYEGDYRAVTASLPKYSMKGRYREPKRMEAPDPGAYALSFATKHSSPKFGFSRSPQRMPLGKSDTPGPGGYHIPATIALKPAYVNSKQDQNLMFI